MSTFIKIIFGLFITSPLYAADPTLLPDYKMASRVLLGEGHTHAKEIGIYDQSLNYNGSPDHHRALGYCTVSLPEEIKPEEQAHAPVFRPDISGNLLQPETWTEIFKTKRSLIADMTFMADTLCPNVMKWVFEALEPEGVYLIPILIVYKKGNFVIQTEIYNDEHPKGDHVSECSGSGITIGTYNGCFPDSNIIRKGSEILDKWVRKSYPDSPIKAVSLNPSPLMRAFWNLPETEKESLCKPIELNYLVDRMIKILPTIDEEMIDSTKNRTYLKEIFEDDPLQRLYVGIGLRLDNASFIEKVKNEAKNEQDRFGDFFGPSGTTFTYGYTAQFPLIMVPAYITIVKN